MHNNPVEKSTTNKNAWVENYMLQLNDQTFRVRINLPSVDKIIVPKLLLAGLPVAAKLECSDEVQRHSMFSWYASEALFDDDDKKPDPSHKKKPKAFDLSNVKWRKVDEARGRRVSVIEKESVGRLIRVECVPSDGQREGVAVEAVSTTVVVAGPDVDSLPMSERHKLTASCLDGSS